MSVSASFVWSSVNCTERRSSHAKRRAGSLVRQSDERALALFGQDDAGRHVTGLSEFDVERGVWSDWPAELQSTAPCARWCHAVCGVGERNLFVFSGDNWLRCLRDAWLFDGRLKRWSRLPLAAIDEPLRSPEARSCAVAAAIDERLVVLSGGVVRMPSHRCSRMLNQIWLVDTLGATVDEVWRLMNVTGDYVIGRESHSMLVDHRAQQLVLFGGSTLRAQMHPDHEQFVASRFDNGDHLLSDVVYVDLKTWRARVVEPDGVSPHVPPRQGHAAMIIDSQRLMVVCGGETSADTRSRTNAVHVWHLDHETWVQAVHVSGGPRPFSFASSCALTDTALILMGGFGSSSSSSIWRLDFAQPPALFELCSRCVARSLPEVILPPRASWSKRAYMLRKTPEAPVRLADSTLYSAQLDAFFADVVEHLRVDVDPENHMVMRAWRESGVPQKLASTLAVSVSAVGDDAAVVQAFRDAAAFAMAHHRSLFAFDVDEEGEEGEEGEEEEEEEEVE